MQILRNTFTKIRQWCENSKEGNPKEKSKCSSKLADQGVDGEDEHLLVLQDVGGDKVEQELVGGQLDWHGGTDQGKMLVGARNLENTKFVLKQILLLRIPSQMNVALQHTQKPQVLGLAKTESN